MSESLKEIGGRQYRFVVGGMQPDDVAHLRASLAVSLGSGEAPPLVGRRDAEAPGRAAPDPAEVGGAVSLTMAPEEPWPEAVLVPIAPGEDINALAERIATEIPQLPAKTAVLLRTSGSTSGRGSLVAMSADALLASARATHDYLGGRGRWVLAMPAHYVAGLQILTRSLLAGLEPVFVDMSGGFDPLALAQAVTEAARGGERVYVSLVETALRRVLAEPRAAAGLVLAERVLVGGGPVPQELREQARERGIAVVATYGMSETGGGCVYDGQPLPGVSMRIEDPDEEGVGRIVLSGPVLAEACWGGSSEIRGNGSSRELWTADRGRVRNSGRGEQGPTRGRQDPSSPRAQGQLEVLGRLDDVIISGGIKIEPSVVEAALLALPQVLEAVAVGVPDREWGQACVAVVVLKDMSPGQVPTQTTGTTASHLESLRTQVRSRLGAQTPKRLLAVRHIPQLSSGKPDRRAITRLYESADR